MKLKLFVGIVFLFLSSCSRKNSCSCDIVVNAFYQYKTYIYAPTFTVSSIESIDKAVTMKQAEDICKNTEAMIFDSMHKRYPVTSESGHCVVK